MTFSKYKSTLSATWFHSVPVRYHQLNSSRGSPNWCVGICHGNEMQQFVQQDEFIVNIVWTLRKTRLSKQTASCQTYKDWSHRPPAQTQSHPSKISGEYEGEKTDTTRAFLAESTSNYVVIYTSALGGDRAEHTASVAFTQTSPKASERKHSCYSDSARESASDMSLGVFSQVFVGLWQGGADSLLPSRHCSTESVQNDATNAGLELPI